jgi:hypothetical protein
MNTFDLLVNMLGKWRVKTWQAAAVYCRKRHTKRFLETGCFRGTPEDGYSTILLAALAKELGGHLESCELNPDNISVAKHMLDEFGLAECVTFRQGDSVLSLASSMEPVEFAYLDSVDCGDPIPSQRHQLAELEALFPRLTRPSAVLLDDNLSDAGKTKLSIQRLHQLGFQESVNDYQVLFELDKYNEFPACRVAVLAGHTPMYAPLAVTTIYQKMAQYCLRHNYCLHVMRKIDPEFFEPESKYYGFSWARLKAMLRLVESGAYEWVWCAGCDVLITNPAMPLDDLLEFDGKHVLMCGERVAPLQADSFLVRCSNEGAGFLKDIISRHQEYRNVNWIDNQAMIDTKGMHDSITQIIPQWRLNAFDYSLFYHLGDIYRSGKDCYGNRGQWRRGDFVIHWPAHDLEQRMRLLQKYQPMIQE